MIIDKAQGVFQTTDNNIFIANNIYIYRIFHSG